MKKLLAIFLTVLTAVAMVACAPEFKSEEHKDSMWSSTDGRMYLIIEPDGVSVNGETIIVDGQRVKYTGKFVDGKLELRTAKTITVAGERLRMGDVIGTLSYEYTGETLVLKLGGGSYIVTASGQILLKKVSIQ